MGTAPGTMRPRMEAVVRGPKVCVNALDFTVVGVGVAAIWTVPEVAVLLFCFSFSFLAHVLQSSRPARPMRCDFPLKMRANT